MGKLRQVNVVGFIWAIVTLIFCPVALSAETLVWETSSGTVDGYKVYYGTSPGDQSNHYDVGNITQLDLNNLPLSEGVAYYLSVSAYNTAGESLPCAPVVFTLGDNTPPSPPAGLTSE